MSCSPIGTTGTRCPRPAEVQVSLLDPDTGATTTRSAVCAVHAFEAASNAFEDVTAGHAPQPVILQPLPTSGESARPTYTYDEGTGCWEPAH